MFTINHNQLVFFLDNDISFLEYLFRLLSAEVKSGRYSTFELSPPRVSVRDD